MVDGQEEEGRRLSMDQIMAKGLLYHVWFLNPGARCIGCNEAIVGGSHTACASSALMSCTKESCVRVLVVASAYG